jgi:hypothetical protein
VRRGRQFDYREHVPSLDSAEKSDAQMLGELDKLLSEFFHSDSVASDSPATTAARTDAWGVAFGLLSVLRKRAGAR